MDVLEAIDTRRSIKEFTGRPVTREEIERLLEAAVQSPNHRMTEPWRFYVLGREARRAYGEALGARLASLHNLGFYLGLMGRARAAIAAGTFASLRAEVLALEAWQFNEAARAWFERQGFSTHSHTMMAKVEG